MYIDIHNHILFGVDDGPADLETSVQLLRAEVEDGAEAIILTPHYRHGMFDYDLELVEQNFMTLRKYAEELRVRLFLGCEYHVNSDMVDYLHDGRVHTLADTDYVLAEFEHEAQFSYLMKHINDLFACGYCPVIAHAERISCLLHNPDRCADLLNRGAMIQINAAGVLGDEGRDAQKFCKRLLKDGTVNLIASDTHDADTRRNRMAECFEYVEDKFGRDYAYELFYAVPRSIIGR